MGEGVSVRVVKEERVMPLYSGFESGLEEELEVEVVSTTTA